MSDRPANPAGVPNRRIFFLQLHKCHIPKCYSRKEYECVDLPALKSILLGYHSFHFSDVGSSTLVLKGLVLGSVLFIDLPALISVSTDLGENKDSSSFMHPRHLTLSSTVAQAC